LASALARIRKQANSARSFATADTADPMLRQSVSPTSHLAPLGTQQNFDRLEQWISEHIREWWEGTQPTTNELFEGHLLVYTLCTDGGTIGPEIQCYQMYIDLVKEVTCSELSEAYIGVVVSSLQRVFRYLDQHLTSSSPRNSKSITKSPASGRLCPEQGLKQVEGLISADPSWTPSFYSVADKTVAKQRTQVTQVKTANSSPTFNTMRMRQVMRDLINASVALNAVSVEPREITSTKYETGKSWEHMVKSQAVSVTSDETKQVDHEWTRMLSTQFPVSSDTTKSAAAVAMKKMLEEAESETLASTHGWRAQRWPRPPRAHQMNETEQTTVKSVPKVQLRPGCGPNIRHKTQCKRSQRPAAPIFGNVMEQLPAEPVELKPARIESKSPKTFRDMLLLGLSEETAQTVSAEVSTAPACKTRGKRPCTQLPSPKTTGRPGVSRRPPPRSSSSQRAPASTSCSDDTKLEKQNAEPLVDFKTKWAELVKCEQSEPHGKILAESEWEKMLNNQLGENAYQTIEAAPPFAFIQHG